MTNVKRAIAVCAGTVALVCAVIQPARAADIPPHYPQQYGAPPVEEGYGYREPPRVYRYAPVPPQVYYEAAPPVVVVPEPYYVPRRRVYIDPGYGGYGNGYRPYVAGGYGYRRGWDYGHRRW
jgi:hypothetical protein